MKAKILIPVAVLIVAGVTFFALGASGPNLEAARISTALTSRFMSGDGPPRPLPMLRTPIRYDVGNRRYRASLYRPLGETRAGVVLWPGTHISNQARSRLVEFAGMLAEQNILVLIPAGRSAQANTAHMIRDAFSYLSELPDIAKREHTGIIVFGNSLSAVIRAASDGHIRNKVKFILVINGRAPSLPTTRLADIQALLLYIQTGGARKQTNSTLGLIKQHLPADQLVVYQFEGRYSNDDQLGLYDRWRLWRLVHDVLRLRDGAV